LDKCHWTNAIGQMPLDKCHWTNAIGQNATWKNVQKQTKFWVYKMPEDEMCNIGTCN
jgi:hypothetical protein